MTRHMIPAALVLLAAACGTVGGGSRGSSDLLTREEIAASTASTAYELLQQLRPQFLRGRGVSSVNDPRPVLPVVYMNNVHHGDLESLRMISVREISEVRFISAADATTRWGTGHAGGVIQIRGNF